MIKRKTENNDYNLIINYKEFLKAKEITTVESGFIATDNMLNENLFDWQKEIVKWCLRKGKSALFEDTGLGKTIQQLSWADAVCKYTKEKVLILTPLAVSKQTVKEGEKFGIEVNIIEEEKDIKSGINITNYEKLHKFDTSQFIGIVLDESSILKSYTGKIAQQIINSFKNTPYKLSCTATPSPNDYIELGQQAEFLGIMTINEMLSMYFINDASHGNGWRLKGHSESEFYKWIATWAMVINNPSNLGYDGTKYILPNLNIQTHIIESKVNEEELSLFPELAETLNERRKARRDSLNDRVYKVNELVNGLDKCLIWCDYNNESELLGKSILNSYEIKGSDTPEHKEKGMLGFSNNEVKYLVSKPSICGFGMNWQNCNNIIFCGLSDSYEQYYQAIRRCWRFGQTKEVNVHIIISEKELNVLNNINKKEKQHKNMTENMIKIMSDISIAELKKLSLNNSEYKPKEIMVLPEFLKA